MLAFVAGLVAGAALVGAGRATDFEGDRSFYPTVLIVIALLYVLFAVQDGRPYAVLAETGAAALFVAMALAGHARSAVWLVGGFALHGLWDVMHDALLGTNEGGPPWWGEFCLGLDGLVAVYLGLRLRRSGGQRAAEADRP